MKHTTLIVLAVVILLAGIGTGYVVCENKHARRAERQAQADTVEAERVSEIQVETIVEYKDLVRTVYVKGETITNEVIKYVPNDDCVVDFDTWRLLNMAAQDMSLPEPAGGSDAAPRAPGEDAVVECRTLRDLVVTVVENYRRSHTNAARLKALQSFIARVGKTPAER